MSDTNSSNWSQLLPGVFVRVMPGNVELLVESHGDIFRATVTDSSGKVVWAGEYPSLIGAKLATIAAAKRLDLLPTESTSAETVVDEPEPEPIEVPAAEQESPQSIWKAIAFSTSVEGDGIKVICTIQLLDDCVEATWKLDGRVYREEFPDEWSAKRATRQWATTLVERHA